VPPYSPDLNPIELMFSKLKALLRRAEERSVSTLWDRIGTCLDQVGRPECANYFKARKLRPSMTGLRSSHEEGGAPRLLGLEATM
jgi:hypothetical protein